MWTLKHGTDSISVPFLKEGSIGFYFFIKDGPSLIEEISDIPAE
ncbi:hypothetical protein ACSS6N_03530 [Peribacillus frigoritolerans]